MKTLLPLAIAASLSLASCASDPIPDFTRSSSPDDAVPSQSISLVLEDSVMEEDVDTLSFQAAQWDGVDVGVDL